MRDPLGEPAAGMRRDRRSVQARIVAAAGVLFATRAPADAGIDEVARAAGVGRATVFRHVGSKQALFDAVYADRAAALVDHAELALAAPRAWEGVELLIRSMARRLAADRGLFTDSAGDLIDTSAATYYDDALARMNAVLARARTARVLSTDLDALSLVRLVRAHARVPWAGRAPDQVDVLLRGLRADLVRTADEERAAPDPGSDPARPDPRTGARAAESGSSRRRILDATIEIASERGYDGTTMARVSTRAGLPVTSLYWHFASKDDLIAAAIIRSARQWEDDLADSIAGVVAGHDDILDRLRDVVRISIIGSPAFLRLGLMLALERRPVDTTAREVYLRFRRTGYHRVLGLVDGLLAGRNDHPAPGRTAARRSVALLFLVLVDGLLIQREIEGHDSVELTRQLDLMVAALRAAADRAPNLPGTSH